MQCILLQLEDFIVFVSILVVSLPLFPFRQTTSLVALFLPQCSFVLYGLPAPEFPRARTRRERTGKAISRKWRAQYTGRRVVQFRISNWYLLARQKVRRYGATKVRFVVENVPRMFRASSSLQHSINNATLDSSH